MKKLLILQMRPETETADSEFEAILNVAQTGREYVHRVRVERLEGVQIDLNNYYAIIAGGSPFDVSYPEHKKSGVQRQVESFFNGLFDQVMDHDFPFLGACSGNGLLGRYCGATISGKYSEPVGSATIAITEEGEKDPLLVGFPKRFTAFVGHKEACDNVPQGAVLLLTSTPCPVQMFRVKKNIYATQFHPEADVEEFILRINTYKNHGYFPPIKAGQLIAAIKGVETPHAKEILRRFANKYQP